MVNINKFFMGFRKIDDTVSQDKKSVKLSINELDLMIEGFKEDSRIEEILNELRRGVRDGEYPNQRDFLLDRSKEIHIGLNLEKFLSDMEYIFNKPGIKEQLNTIYEIQEWLNEHPDEAQEIDKKIEEMIKK